MSMVYKTISERAHRSTNERFNAKNSKLTATVRSLDAVGRRHSREINSITKSKCYNVLGIFMCLRGGNFHLVLILLLNGLCVYQREFGWVCVCVCL